MKILLLTSYVPAERIGGSAIVAYNLITRFARQHQVMVCCFTTGTDEENDYIEQLRAQNIEVLPFVHPGQRVQADSRWRKVMRLFERYPFQIQAFVNEELKARFEAVVREWQPDIIQSELLRLAWVIDLPHGSARTVFETHAVSTDLSLQDLNHSQGLKARLLAAWEYWRTRRAEAYYCRHSNLVTAVMQEDCDRLRGLSGVKAIELVTVGVDFERFHPLPPCDDRRLIFTASLFYKPNIDGITWFCHEVLPRVQAKFPDASLTIVGRNPAPEVYALAERPGVTVYGSVPSMQEYVASAAVMINPLTTGGGIKQKLIEAMAWERASVTTTFGRLGIPAVDGVHTLVADSAADFAASCIRLLDDRDLRYQMAHAARQLVERQFSWDAVVERWYTLYDRVLQGRELASQTER
jgi:glycosyltransferase involved in cell wall biosynthesis